MQQPLNDACKELIPPDLPLATRSRMARELFEFFKAESLNTGAYGDVLRGAPERVANHTDDQLFHEYLEDTNCPMFFSDFALEAHRNGLAYLGDADLEWMFPDRMRPGFGKTIRERMAGDRLSVDFLTGRSFRRSLLVASEQSDRMAKQVTIDKIANLHFHVAGDFNVHFGKDKVEFKDKHGRIRLSGEADFAPLVKLLVEKFPASVTLAECQAGLPAKHSKAVAEALFGMTISGILIATSTHLPAGKPGNRPRASLLARSDAAAGLDVTVNRRHEVVRIDAVGKVLIPALDGNTSHDDLVALVCDASAAGTLVLQKDGIVETDQSRLREAVPDMVVNFIKGYAQTGLLEA
jgi:methyltransferase-like protein